MVLKNDNLAWEVCGEASSGWERATLVQEAVKQLQVAEVVERLVRGYLGGVE